MPQRRSSSLAKRCPSCSRTRRSHSESSRREGRERGCAPPSHCTTTPAGCRSMADSHKRPRSASGSSDSSGSLSTPPSPSNKVYRSSSPSQCVTRSVTSCNTVKLTLRRAATGRSGPARSRPRATAPPRPSPPPPPSKRTTASTMPSYVPPHLRPLTSRSVRARRSGTGTGRMEGERGFAAGSFRMRGCCSCI